MRYFLELAYRGTAYHGWQKQPNAVTIQEIVEKALATIVREPIEIVGAGRTDAGVHAKQLFAHFDLNATADKNFVFKLNSLLPQDIAALKIIPVKQNAHARFDAQNRSYKYYIVQKKDPFAIDAAYLVKRELNVDVMNEAAQILMEYQDFEAFSRTHTDVKTFNCDIKEAYWKQTGSKLIFYITADRFLRNMVRAIVGTILDIGLEKSPLSGLHQIIKNKDRSGAGASAPAHGLYLNKIEYPEKIFIN